MNLDICIILIIRLLMENL